MEQQLAESPWNSLTEGTAVSPHQATVKERDVINRLEGQVDEQRKMRLNDAKQVEAKAAKIKEWVTNKLRDVRENKCQNCRVRTMSTRRRIKFNLQFGNGGRLDRRESQNKRCPSRAGQFSLPSGTASLNTHTS